MCGLHNIVAEDLAQAPCVISASEVLWTCPIQHKDFLTVIEGLDPSESNLIMFDGDVHCYKVSHQVSFYITVCIFLKVIYHTLLDEGSSTCVMSVSYWKAIISLELTKLPLYMDLMDTTLCLRAFF